MNYIFAAGALNNSMQMRLQRCRPLQHETKKDFAEILQNKYQQQDNCSQHGADIGIFIYQYE